MILLNMERLCIEVTFSVLSDIEQNPESPRIEDKSPAFLGFLENARERAVLVPETVLAEAVGTGLTPKIDLRADVDSSKEQVSEEKFGLTGVEVDWVVGIGKAILALNIFGTSRGNGGTGVSFISLL